MQKWIIALLCLICLSLFSACQTCPKPDSHAYQEKEDNTNWDENTPEKTGLTLSAQRQFILGSVSSAHDIDFFRVESPQDAKRISLEVCYEGAPALQKNFILVVRVYNKQGDFKRFYYATGWLQFDFDYNDISHLLIGVYGNPACTKGNYSIYFNSEPASPTSTPKPAATFTKNNTIPTPQPSLTENITLLYSIDIRLYIDQMVLTLGDKSAQKAGKVVGWFIDTIFGSNIKEIVEALMDPLDKEFLFPKLDIYKVNYQSVAADGITPAMLSGLLLVPAGRNSLGTLKVPILGYTHGTTLEKSQVPSCFNIENPFNTFEVLVAMIYASLYGYVTVLPDYQGMGDDVGAVQPYMCKEPLSRAVADMLLLAKRFLTETPPAIAPLPRNNLSVDWNGQTYLAGYSQGGYVAMISAWKLQEEKYKSLNLVATASCAGPHSLDETMRLLMLRKETFSAAFFLPMTIRGFYSTYLGKKGASGKDLGSYFTAEYAFKKEFQDIWYLTDGNQSPDYVEQEIAKRMNVNLNNIIPADMLSDALKADMGNPASDVYKILTENNSYNWNLDADKSLRLFHSPYDDLVPYDNSVVASNAFQAQGYDVQLVQAFFVPMGVQVHIEAALAAFLSAYIWLNDIRSTHAVLSGGDFLQPGYELRSPSGNACLRYQLDGKLKVYDRITGSVVWDAGYPVPAGSETYLTVMRFNNGRLTVCDLHGNFLWNSDNPEAGSTLQVTDEKQLQILDKKGKVVWSTPQP